LDAGSSEVIIDANHSVAIALPGQTFTISPLYTGTPNPLTNPFYDVASWIVPGINTFSFALYTLNNRNIAPGATVGPFPIPNMAKAVTMYGINLGMGGAISWFWGGASVPERVNNSSEGRLLVQSKSEFVNVTNLDPFPRQIKLVWEIGV